MRERTFLNSRQEEPAPWLWEESTMEYRGLRLLLLVHGLITLAAAVVLAVDPDLIPSIVGIRLERNASCRLSSCGG